MPGISAIVPYGADQTVYLVVEALGSKAAERTEIETVISELLLGRFDNPIRILAFNTLEHWTDDLSKDVAQEIQCRCDIDGDSIPGHLDDFVRRNIGN